MPKRIAIIAAFGLLGSLYSIDAQAFPTSFLAKNVAWSNVIVVRNFCCLGFHRNVYGYCVRNGAPYRYLAPAGFPPRVCHYPASAILAFEPRPLKKATLEVIEVQFLKRLLSRQLHSMTATAIYGKGRSPAARFRLSTPTPTRYIHGA